MLVDPEDGVCGIKYEKPSRHDYFFYSENLYREQIEQKYRKAMRKFEEAKEIQASLDRNKDSIEKITNSLKNEVEIKPLRVWTEKSIRGALVIGFLAQLIISLIRYEQKTLKHTSTKFIKYSLMNLTVTVEKLERGGKRRIFSNFDVINWLILHPEQGVT